VGWARALTPRRKLNNLRTDLFERKTKKNTGKDAATWKSAPFQKKKRGSAAHGILKEKESAEMHRPDVRIPEMRTVLSRTEGNSDRKSRYSALFLGDERMSRNVKVTQERSARGHEKVLGASSRGHSEAVGNHRKGGDSGPQGGTGVR